MKARSSPSSQLEKLRRRMLEHAGPDEELPARAIAEFSAKALLANFAAIQAQVPEQAILPMIKANAYGHGTEWVARQLLLQPRLYGFGVATLEEGAELRAALGPKSRKA